MKAKSVAALISVLFVAGLNMQANAGANDFFGSSMGGAPSGPIGGSPDTQQGGASVGNGMPSVPAGDYTGDEKRVQKKYKSAISHARKLIAKGESMMKSKGERDVKKGKILK